jgi:hypothetical protein
VIELLPFGIIGVPTVLLALRSKTRRFALLPLGAILLFFGSVVSLRMGQFLRATSLQPESHRCGDPFFIPLIGMLAIGGWTCVTGAVLTASEASRGIGQVVLAKLLPAFILLCLISGLVGRYALP